MKKNTKKSSKKRVAFLIIAICVLVVAVLLFGFFGKVKERPPKREPLQEGAVPQKPAVSYNISEKVD